jgi:hypothetical protein
VADHSHGGEAPLVGTPGEPQDETVEPVWPSADLSRGADADENGTSVATPAGPPDDFEPRLRIDEGIPGLSGHRDDVQGLRAVAVLLVVLGHAGVGFLKGGYVGVDVFFVLSGVSHHRHPALTGGRNLYVGDEKGLEERDRVGRSATTKAAVARLSSRSRRDDADLCDPCHEDTDLRRHQDLSGREEAWRRLHALERLVLRASVDERLLYLVVDRTIVATTAYRLQLVSPFRGAFRRALFQ